MSILRMVHELRRLRKGGPGKAGGLPRLEGSTITGVEIRIGICPEISIV